MKFAKELEQDLVPEWRVKYFDYKTGKKKIKAAVRALRAANATPSTPGRQLPSSLFNNALRSPLRPSHPNSTQSTPNSQGKTVSSGLSGRKTRGSTPEEEDGSKDKTDALAGSSPKPVSETTSPKPTGDRSTIRWDSGEMTNYGSFIVSPGDHAAPLGPPALELPDPALAPDEDAFAKHNRAWRHSRLAINPHSTPPSQRIDGQMSDAHPMGTNTTAGKTDASQLLPKHKRFLRPRRSVSTQHRLSTASQPRILRRIFSSSAPSTPTGDVPLEAYKAFEEKQGDFFRFLDEELSKIEGFYKMKEMEANKRLQVLRDQLHVMRDRRLDEIRREQEAKRNPIEQQERQKSGIESAPPDAPNGHVQSKPTTFGWMKPIEKTVGLGSSGIGKTSKALQKLGSSTGPIARNLPGASRPESWRDFTRRPAQPDIPYRAAKRKLKLALQEFYRGLELLKAYALLNRTAFRKINKKYDKAVKARPTQRYMTEKVNKSWFVQSEVLDHQIVAVEDLYTRYFERGNHKVAVSKLRSRPSKFADFTGSVFRNGMLIAAGLVFGIQGIVYSAQHLTYQDASIQVQTSYLLQIYGGYFLMLLLFLLFCLNCKVWTQAKINYPFIFEFDARHSICWHQLSELPCLLLFLLGLFIWLNFQQDGTNAMFLYWPVILIGISTMILMFPGPILYSKSRRWWAYANFRLLLAGLYPVEFRDFFLGDMYCSLTYSMGNLELFFCLYAHYWSNPPLCNSSHSRLLGFISTLPGIWRALQCLRRYYDTRNAFPHLVNCGKYAFTILSYMTLSLYRIDKAMSLKALFIACSTINSIYCSIWDLAMDWSLCDPYAHYPFLRDVLGYKNPKIYYLAMVFDPILRFNWIFYAIYSQEVQHSALLSFLVSLSEVFRRGMWTLFRVENEHCTNVGRFRASRDVPLPYDLRSPSQPPSPTVDLATRWDQLPAPMTRHNTYDGTSFAGLSTNIEAQQFPSSSSLRRRATLTESETPIIRGIARVGTAINKAHAQDFERRRPTEATTGIVGLERSPLHQDRTLNLEDSSEEDEGDEEEVEQEMRSEGDSPIGVMRREEASGNEREQDRRDMLDVEDVLDRRRSAVE